MNDDQPITGVADVVQSRAGGAGDAPTADRYLNLALAHAATLTSLDAHTRPSSHAASPDPSHDSTPRFRLCPGGEPRRDRYRRRVYRQRADRLVLTLAALASLAGCGGGSSEKSDDAKARELVAKIELSESVSAVASAALASDGEDVIEANAALMAATNDLIDTAEAVRADVPEDHLRDQLQEGRAAASDGGCGLCAETIDVWIAELEP